MSAFDWRLFPKAESYLQTKLDEFLSRNSSAKTLTDEIQQKTSTKIFDWVDHLAIPSDEVDVDDLFELGFSQSKNAEGAKILRVEGSTLFPALLQGGRVSELALAVEEVDCFGKIYGVGKRIEGLPNSAFRKLAFNGEGNFRLSFVERRGSLGYTIEDNSDVDVYVEAAKTLASRKRTFNTEQEGILETGKILRNFESKLSRQRLADAFFRAERRYWESRNHAATVQKARQDAAGMGWGNVDHHTFRSSRENFAALIGIFEFLGLRARERFHAGAQAGWGAQILEDADGRNVVFADVDLSVEEKEADFAHQGLEARDKFGTVGLWVSLHGESILEAGMHHLAAKFRFDDIQVDLKGAGVGMMKPFSNFPFLKQAFTEPEKWRVKKDKLTVLLKKQQLREEEASAFARDGAVASHLEDIQRGQGFKGFNQNSVSAIIRWTNPLAQLERAA